MFAYYLQKVLYQTIWLRYFLSIIFRMNFCPCLQSLLNKFKSKKTKSSYEGPREFEEEEFMNPHGEEITLSDTIAHQPRHETQRKQPQASIETKPVKTHLVPSFEEDEKEPQTQILNIKMEMPDIQMQVKSSPVVVEIKEERSIEQLIQAELLITPSEVVRQSAVERQEVKQYPEQHLEELVQQPTFAVNLDPLDPHFALIHEKANLVPELLRKDGQRLELGSPNKTGLEIMIVQNSRKSSFVLRYTLNCSYSFYLSVLRAEKALTSLGGLIAEAKTLESYRPNLTLNTLKFKRLGGLEARDCFYVKYQNGGKRHHWELYLNDESTARSPQFKTCEVFCCKSLVQEGERELKVTEYLQIDLGASSLSSVIPKLAAEMRNFLNLLNEHLDHNYEQQLA